MAKTVVKGIEHGLGGYTNYECRCNVCTEANREHSRQYRARKFAGQPLCVIKRCPSVQSRAYGNGLCYNHAREVLAFRRELEDMDRMQLKRVIKRESLGIKVLRRHSDEHLRELIEAELGVEGMAYMAEAA